jgi:hypothetical protein
MVVNIFKVRQVVLNDCVTFFIPVVFNPPRMTAVFFKERLHVVIEEGFHGFRILHIWRLFGVPFNGKSYKNFKELKSN